MQAVRLSVAVRAASPLRSYRFPRQCHQAVTPDYRPPPMNDLTAFRQLLKNPGFTACPCSRSRSRSGRARPSSACWTPVLRRGSFNQPDQLVQVWEDPGEKDRAAIGVRRRAADWREQTHSFQQMAALWRIETNLTGPMASERITGAQVSANFFDLLQVKPRLGRGFLPEEDRPGRNQVVILDHTLWQRRSGRHPTSSIRPFIPSMVAVTP